MLSLGQQVTCLDCATFLVNYRHSVELYAKLMRELEAMAAADRFDEPGFALLKRQVETARLDCNLSKEALRIHKEGHNS